MTLSDKRSDLNSHLERSDIDSDMFSLVAELGKELHITESVLSNLSLQTSLDSELGLDSLSRMELFSRVERQFGVSLSQELLMTITTLSDLKSCLLTARGKGGRQLVKTTSSLTLSLVENTPLHCKTLIEVLQWHVNEHPERPHISLYEENGEGRVLTYADLYKGASAIATGLRKYGLDTGQTVALMLPTGKDYFLSFMGVLLAGGIPVPLYPPARIDQLEDHLRRHSTIVANCEAEVLITFKQARQVARLLKAQVPEIHDIFTVDEISDFNILEEFPLREPSDFAFIQYTSGSTGQPKGVVLTHQNLLSNIRAMGDWMTVTAEDVIVSWLPLYHDMGLIGCWLGSLYYSCLFVVMSPLEFLARPERWLWAIHRYRGSISAAPNFAYELCLKRIKPDYIDGLDLSSMRAMLNGAEAVSPKTIKRFTERFQPYQLDPHAYMPVYGLAENCVGLAFPPMGRLSLVDRIDREIFSNSGRAVPVTHDTNALEFVACGQPLQENEIRIVDELGKEVAERQQGRLHFRSTSMTCGYYKNPQQTAKYMHQGWFDTGDMAYLANGDVFITGRIKDIIIHGGRNLYPAELEEAVGTIEGVRKGCVAVFGAKDRERGTEKLVVLAETRLKDDTLKETLRQAINKKTVDVIGTPPDHIVLAPPHSVLKTSSGKVRRSASREMFEQGAIGRQPRGLISQVLHLLVASAQPVVRRVVRLSLSLGYAAWFWSVVVILSPIVWLSLMICPNKSWRWRLLPVLGRLMGNLLGIKATVEGVDNLLPTDQTCVYVANHASYLDAFVLLTCIPRRFHFVAKADLKETWLFRVLLERLDVEFVERDEKQKALQDAAHLMQLAAQGESLLYFPEGILTRADGLYAFHVGAFLTAAKSKQTVVPIAMKGTRSILRPEGWFPRHGAVSVKIGQPITVAGKENLSEWERAMALHDQARQFILHNCGEADLARQSRVKRQHFLHS